MSLSRELVEERAAIVEEGCKCTRWLAQLTVAKEHGFSSWRELVRACK